ncbi:MAG: hypothetical protein ACTHNN_17200 [Xanthobacteraceae bacterium]
MITLDQDAVLETHRRVGRRLAEAAFATFPRGDATENQMFAIERMFHAAADGFMSELGGDDDQKLLAKIVIGSTMRSRYADLVRSSSAVERLRP